MTEEQIKQKADDYIITRQNHIKYFSGEAVKILLKNFAEEIVTEATKELEAQIEKMKCCGNCGDEKCTSKYRGNSAYHTQTDGFACADNEDWKPREIKEK